MKNKKVTVFTPTYNRGYIIENLYNSLKNQTNKNFEWLVVDDGSLDNTENFFKEIKIQEKDFEITYIKKQNGGKHRAINTGVEFASGDLFFIVDSDDILTRDAIDKIIKWESNLKNKENYAGISGNRGYDKNRIIGQTFKGDYLDATSLEREEYGILGDKAEVFYTEILKKFRFPEYENENFITESVVWYEIASKGYKIRWFNEIIYIGNYLEDGLTKSGREIFTKNPKGYAKAIQVDINYLNKGVRYNFSKYFNYYKDTNKNLTKKEMIENLKISKWKLYLSIFLGKINNFIKRLKNENK